MCGITAILSDPASTVDPAVIRRMTDALKHRGPDDQQVVHLAGCQLGHTRLSILDPIGGVQPMAHPSGRWTIVFNGEIYNHGELREHLQARGVVLRTRSDTEVLLHAYVEFGPACLNRLNGQFAFAVWDRDRQELFAARDRFGEKPLYWARSPHGHVLVASELKAIVASGLVAPRIDLLSVEMYLGLYYVPPDRTIYRNIHTLQPGHAIVWRRGERGVCDDIRAYRWWTPRFSHLRIDREDAVAEIRRLLAAAVRRQMVADVKVGAFLSGGLDSSTIVGLMSAETSGRQDAVSTFAAGFGELLDELPFARDVADRWGTRHHESHVEQIDVAGELAAMSAIYDEPFGDSSNIPTTLISRQARQGVKVVLSGDGGDELFGGYAWYEPAIALAARRAAETDAWSEHVGRTGPIAADRTGLWGFRGQPSAVEPLRQRFAGAGVRKLDVATQFDVACYLPGDILVKVDRAAMSCGLETRAPFLDSDLAEFVLSLPWHLRFGLDAAPPAEVGDASPATGTVGVMTARSSRPTLRFSADGRTVVRSVEHTSRSVLDQARNQTPITQTRPLKSLLRDACGDLWPASIRKRGKQGFGAPVRHWLLRPEIRGLWQQVTSPQGSLAALLPGICDPNVTEALRPQRQWSLLCLGVWLQGRESCLSELCG